MKDGEKGSQEISRRIRKCLVSEVRKENSQEPLFVMGREGNLLKGKRTRERIDCWRMGEASKRRCFTVEEEEGKAWARSSKWVPRKERRIMDEKSEECSFWVDKVRSKRRGQKISVMELGEETLRDWKSEEMRRNHRRVAERMRKIYGGKSIFRSALQRCANRVAQDQGFCGTIAADADVRGPPVKEQVEEAVPQRGGIIPINRRQSHPSTWSTKNTSSKATEMYTARSTHCPRWSRAVVRMRESVDSIKYCGLVPYLFICFF